MPSPNPAPRASSVSDGHPVEDPFPTAKAACGRPKLAIAGVLGGPALAWPGFGAAGELTNVASLSPLHLLLCFCAAGLAGFGALAATSLLGYSPALLAQSLEEEGRQDAGRLTDDLARRATEYLVVAMAYTAIGWILGLWALGQAVPSPHQGLALGLFTGFMLLLAGSLPAAITQVRAERTLLAVRPALRAGWWLLRWPLVLPLLGTTRLCLHLLGIRANPKGDLAEVQKQVMAAVADSVTEHPLAEAERTWIGNIVGLKDLQVSTIMTPRPDIVAFAESLPLRDAVHKALEHGFSRYPVYRERIDEIVGIFYVKDALRLLQENAGLHAETPLSAMLRESLYVPETMGLAQLLRRFQTGHLHMAIVLDEYGTTAGLVSVEDVLEQIVGDIGDEYDSQAKDEAAAGQIHVVAEGRVLEIPARATVAEVNQLLGTELPEDGDWETVAGMVIARCNHIPVVDESIVVDGVEFRVLEADDRRIRRLRVTSLSPQPAEGAR